MLDILDMLVVDYYKDYLFDMLEVDYLFDMLGEDYLFDMLVGGFTFFLFSRIKAFICY